MRRSTSPTRRLFYGFVAAALGLSGALVAVQPAAAATTLVTKTVDDGTSGTLRFAVNEANADAGPDEINFSPALSSNTLVVASELLVTEDLTINGLGSTQFTISRAAPGFDIFRVQMHSADQNFDIHGITVQGNGAANSGRGLLVEGPGMPANFSTHNVTIDDVDFAQLNSSGIGGGAAILSITGDIDISNTTFRQNVSATDGGGLAIENSGDVTIDQSHFLSNTAADSGGGISIEDASDVSVTTTEFLTNKATGGVGGAAAISSATNVGFTDATTGTHNTAGLLGGFAEIDSVGGTVRADESTFTLNSAGNSGGAFYVGNVHAVDMLDSVFDQNFALGDGGAASLLGIGGIGGQVRIQSTFTTNAAALGLGGALRIDSGAPVTIAQSVFDSNNGSRGGAIYFDALASSSSISSSTFSRNIATANDGTQPGDGGAIVLSDIPLDVTFTITDTSVLDNTATDLLPDRALGAGLFVGELQGSIDIVSSTFASNQFSGSGLGLAAYFTFIADTGSFVMQNSTVDEVGPSGQVAMFLNEVDGTVGLRFDTIAGPGGVHFNDQDGVVDVSHVIADGHAFAAFYLDAGDPVDVDNSLLNSGVDAASVNPVSNVTFNVADFKLGALASNGGPTQTRLPLAGSPAIDGGLHSVIADAPDFDQRGTGFPRLVHGIYDIGAVEVIPTLAATGGTINPWIVLIGIVVLLLGIGAVVVAALRRRAL